MVDLSIVFCMFTRGYTRNDMNHFWGYNNWIEQRNYATEMSFVRDDPNHHWMILKVRCAGVNKPCASWITLFQVTSRGKTPLICLITLSQLQPRFHGSISLCLPFLSQFLHVQSHISYFMVPVWTCCDVVPFLEFFPDTNMLFIWTQWTDCLK